MRKLKYYVAATLDGYIAREDHTVDGFLTGEGGPDYIGTLRREYDTALMGRKTYEFGLREGVTNPYPWMRQYVFSGSMPQSPDPAVELVRGGWPEFVRRLKGEPGKHIYLCGGAELASLLLAENLVDEVVVKLHPVLFGSGIPLFRHLPRTVELERLGLEPCPNGITVVQYQVKPAPELRS